MGGATCIYWQAPNQGESLQMAYWKDTWFGLNSVRKSVSRVDGFVMILQGATSLKVEEDSWLRLAPGRR